MEHHKMSIFRFNSFGWRDYSDEDGVELSGHAEARSQAMRALGQILRDHADDTDKDSIMVVTDSRGQVVCELSFTMRGA